MCTDDSNDGDQEQAQVSERIDLVHAKDVDKIIAFLQSELLLDLTDLKDFVS